MLLKIAYGKLFTVGYLYLKIRVFMIILNKK